MKRIFGIFILALMVSSCADGTYILTGQQRKPIDPSLVKVYTVPPHKYEVIAIVSAESIFGLFKKHEIDNDIAELKKQAAKFGANGLKSIKVHEIQHADEKTIEVTGHAIYVIKE